MSLTCDVIKVLKTESVDEYNRIDVRIVKWSNSSSNVLEKRRMYTKKDGTDTSQRMVGLNRGDLVFILENLVEIENLIGGSDEVR